MPSLCYPASMFGGFSRNLQHWVEAGLITQDQSSQILAHEKTRKSGKLQRDLTNVGVFSILLGILAIVAANWQDIPPFGKLGLHMILNLGVAALIPLISPSTHPYKRDICVVALGALFLTFIALIAQIYQLHGELYQTLLFWLALCTPFLLYWGKTYVAIVPWLAAALVTLFLTGTDFATFKDSWVWIMMVMAVYLPLALLSAARSGFLANRKPGFTLPLYNLGFFLPGFFASFATLAFNEADRLLAHHSLLLTLLASGVLITFILFRPWGKARAEPQAFDLSIYLLISGILVLLPFCFLGFKSGLLAGVLFILYWLYLAWLGARIHSSALTDWAIRLIMLRLFILYLEVFGSMMNKGLGMILSGVLLIILIRYSSRIVALGRKIVRYEI